MVTTTYSGLGLVALSPLRVGCDWETNAIPEVRGQAASLAATMAAADHEQLLAG
ncbi:MAG: hypothetical protein ACRDWD_17015 [Acidimicrobiia bacterium]